MDHLQQRKDAWTMGIGQSASISDDAEQILKKNYEIKKS